MTMTTTKIKYLIGQIFYFPFHICIISYTFWQMMQSKHTTNASNK